MNAWDALAGLVLVKEAGGLFNAFLENDGLMRGNLVLAGNPDVWRRLAVHAGILAAEKKEVINAG
jgi:myo-inositol-1(or 4)-monophosphatase